MKLSYSTWGMPRVPIRKAVEYCADLGFDGLELTIIPGWVTDADTLTTADRRQIRQIYDDAGLELSGISGNVPLMTGSTAEQTDATERFKRYLDFASEIQRPGQQMIVTTTSGSEHGHWDEIEVALVDRLGELAEYAGERGVMVGIEPHVATALHLPDQAIWLLDQVGHSALTVHFDISHFNVQDIPMEESIAKLTPISRHTHIKDERGLWPNHQFLIPGEGETDYVAYLQAMDAAEYRDHIVVEISLMVQGRPDYDPLQAASTSWKILDEAFGAAGI